jgi:hypothetical protein
MPRETMACELESVQKVWGIRAIQKVTSGELLKKTSNERKKISRGAWGTV